MLEPNVSPARAFCLGCPCAENETTNDNENSDVHLETSEQRCFSDGDHGSGHLQEEKEEEELVTAFLVIMV